MCLELSEEFRNRYDEYGGQILSILIKHIVCLSWIDVKSEPDSFGNKQSDFAPDAFAVSTFVVSIKNIWFLVTAGHILKDLQSRLDSGRRIFKSRLFAGLISPPSSESIPFNLEDTPRWYIYEDGLDYAVIPLRPAFVNPLIADGIIALNENHWKDYPEEDGEYVLLGFPSQAQDISITSSGEKGNVNIVLGCPLLPVFPVSDPPEVLKRQHERFYAKVPIAKGMTDDPNVKLTDINGMSGGPLFVIKWINNNNIEYWLVAVQSGWHKPTRILAACPILPLINGIANSIDKHLKSTDEYTLP
jgi:hypothetical protein